MPKYDQDEAIKRFDETQKIQAEKAREDARLMQRAKEER